MQSADVAMYDRSAVRAEVTLPRERPGSYKPLDPKVSMSYNDSTLFEMLVVKMEPNDPERDVQRKTFEEAIRFHEWACEELVSCYQYATRARSGIRDEKVRRTAALQVLCKTTKASMASARRACETYWEFIDGSEMFDSWVKMSPTEASIAAYLTWCLENHSEFAAMTGARDCGTAAHGRIQGLRWAMTMGGFRIDPKVLNGFYPTVAARAPIHVALDPEHLARDGLWPFWIVLRFEEMAGDLELSEVVRFYCASFCLKVILSLRGIEMQRAKIVYWDEATRVLKLYTTGHKKGGEGKYQPFHAMMPAIGLAWMDWYVNTLRAGEGFQPFMYPDPDVTKLQKPIDREDLVWKDLSVAAKPEKVKLMFELILDKFLGWTEEDRAAAKLDWSGSRNILPIVALRLKWVSPELDEVGRWTSVERSTAVYYARSDEAREVVIRGKLIRHVRTKLGTDWRDVVPSKVGEQADYAWLGSSVSIVSDLYDENATGDAAARVGGERDGHVGSASSVSSSRTAEQERSFE